jgi:hypothetical protein
VLPQPLGCNRNALENEYDGSRPLTQLEFGVAMLGLFRVTIGVAVEFSSPEVKYRKRGGVPRTTTTPIGGGEE